MKKTFYKEAVNKLMDYKQRYPDSPLKCAFKAGSFGFIWALGNILSGRKRTWKSDNRVIKVAFILSNMIGDVLVNLRYLQAFRQKLPEDSQLDIYSDLNSEVMTGLLYKKSFVHAVFTGNDLDSGQYDLVIRLIRFPELLGYSENIRGKSDPFLLEYIDVVDRFRKENPFFFVNRYGDRPGIEWAKLDGKTRHTQSDIGNLVGLERTSYILEADPRFKSILEQYGLKEKKYITLQRGIAGTGEFTRLWPISRYEELVASLKKEYPGYRIIQLGREDTSVIRGIDLDLRGKTGFEELKNLLKYAELHIDGDCGMVHVRHALQGGCSVVLFGPTSPDFIGYPENINMRGNGCPGDCEWVNISWQEKCVRGFDDPLPCMPAAGSVLEEIKKNWDN